MSSEEVKIEHESFGFIRASRVSGNTELFDSALKHQHYVTVTIGEAQQYRRYNDTYVYGGLRGLIEVAMSEAQFAQFITSINVGSGSPCTLKWVNGTYRKPPPPDINTRETFKEEVKEQALKVNAAVKDGLTAIDALLAKGKATKGELQALRGQIETAQRELVSNMPFMMERFAEGIEKLTERAKMDINAHAVMLGQRMMTREGDGKPTLELTCSEGADGNAPGA